MFRLVLLFRLAAMLAPPHVSTIFSRVNTRLRLTTTVLLSSTVTVSCSLVTIFMITPVSIDRMISVTEPSGMISQCIFPSVALKKGHTQSVPSRWHSMCICSICVAKRSMISSSKSCVISSSLLGMGRPMNQTGTAMGEKASAPASFMPG